MFNLFCEVYMWKKGTPSNSGDYFLVKLNGKEITIFFCPQLGWVDLERNEVNISQVFEYCYLGDKL